MDDGRMPFGRDRGLALELVSVESLAWAAERMSNPPQAVMAELRRRAERSETHDGLVAQAALSNRLFNRRKKGRLSQKAFWASKVTRLLSKQRRR